MATRKPAAPPADPPPSSAERGPPDLTTIGGRLRFVRELRGMKHKPLSLAAGLSTAAGFQIEDHPTRDVRVGTLVALCEQLDAHPAWLAFGLGPMEPFPDELRPKKPPRAR